MKKVTIEITEKGYKTIYKNGKKEFIEEWESTTSGARVISERDFESLTENEVSDKMWDALDDKDPYVIMKALQSEY
ncbi:hypothetical protein [Senegalia massiliensis]|uniref:Uncharacterized protein n=1 Tax=Senegalia massiliensis TaxID=1720316 RepID=A0A845QSK2_9CLOT|nr:hypothetical protein [Senegalia massiliensis]NBI05787.1 hypothetical protein [Senegalia massiliensis]